MNSIIFEDEERGIRVLLLVSDGYTNYYMQVNNMQVNSSDWFFCVGDKTPFDEVTREYVEYIMDEFYPLIVDDEQALEKKHQNDW